MKLYDELKWRGLIKDVSSPEIEKLLNDEKISFYWGTDPTADSLHLGHYSSLITAKRLALAGHHPILLVGGATALIGDPRPTAERELIDKDTVFKNLEGIKNQVDKIFEGKAEIVNNYDWTKNISFLDFLRDCGKYINVNYMLDKDIIRRRLETGITFAEFAYTLIQGNDFLHLFQEKNCILQAEGSDQWGNITTGIDLIKKKLKKEAYGFTMPLITDKFGNKFGKSDGNALWLDINKTSSYELYQYLLNVDDEMVISYLKVFTFLTPDEINELEKLHKIAPEKREAHKALAHEIIENLHGEKEYDRAVKISECLFNGKINELTEKETEQAFKNIPSFELKLNEKIIDILVSNNIATSKREAREFLTNNSITVNGEKITDENKIITSNDLLHKKYLIIRKGKKKYFIGK